MWVHCIVYTLHHLETESLCQIHIILLFITVIAISLCHLLCVSQYRQRNPENKVWYTL